MKKKKLIELNLEKISIQIVTILIMGKRARRNKGEGWGGGS